MTTSWWMRLAPMRARSASRISSSLERSASASEMPAVVVKGSEPWSPAWVASRRRWANSSAAPRAGVGQDDRELVAAHAVGDVRAAPRGPDRVGQGLQALVAGLVAVGVVDGLEVVEVEEDQRQRHAGAAHALQLARDVLVEGAVVAQARERIGDRHLGQPLDLGGDGRVDAAAVAHDDGSEERDAAAARCATAIAIVRLARTSSRRSAAL